MAEPLVLTMLRSKRDQVEQSIAGYERSIEQAKCDLAHVSATLAMFEAQGDDRHIPSYIDTHRLLRKGEFVRFAKAELAKGEPLDTRELTRRLMAEKGLDPNDAMLRRAIAERGVRALIIQARRGVLKTPGKVRRVRVWALADGSKAGPRLDG